MNCRLKKELEGLSHSGGDAHETPGKVEKKHGKRDSVAYWKEYGLEV